MKKEVKPMPYTGGTVFVKYKEGEGGLSLTSLIEDYNFLCAFYNSVTAHLRDEIGDIRLR